MKQRYDNADSLRGEDTTKKIVCGVAIALIVSWMGWISLRGINSGDNVSITETNKVVAIVEKDVAILKAGHAIMKEDIGEIKSLTREIRNDQIRRYRLSVKGEN